MSRGRIAGMLVGLQGGLSVLVACTSLEGMQADQPCLEAGYAIASRTFDCTEDGDLANERYERFVDEMACIPHPLEEEEGGKTNPQKDLFHCAYVIRTLSCEDADAFGDELDAWLSVSPACNLVVTYGDGTPLPPFDGFTAYDPDPVSDPVCSDEQGPPVTFDIVNSNPNRDLALYWLQNGSCVETYYAPLRFAELITQSTYEGHVWVVRDPATEELIDWFVAEPDLYVEVQ